MEDMEIDDCNNNNVVLPGDPIKLSSDKIKLGPGLTQNEESIISLKAGILECSESGKKWWVDNNQKRVSNSSRWFYSLLTYFWEEMYNLLNITLIWTILLIIKKYVPASGESVLGIVTFKTSEYYRLDIGSAHQAILSSLAFENVTKKNRPNLNVISFLFVSVLLWNNFNIIFTKKNFFVDRKFSICKSFISK